MLYYFMLIKETVLERGDIVCPQIKGTHLKNNFYFTYLGSSDRRS